jgi:hypothetical protein
LGLTACFGGDGFEMAGGSDLYRSADFNLSPSELDGRL